MTETGQRTIRGTTPTDAASVQKLLTDLPPNSTITFYDGRTVFNTGQRKLPPFYHIKKEVANFGGGQFIYICTDNRGQPIGKQGADVVHIAKDIVSLTILNKYVAQYNKNYTTHRPAGISRKTPVGKVLPLDALKKIKPNIPKK